MKNPWLWLIAGVCAIVCSSFLAYPILKRMALHELAAPTPLMEASVKVHVTNGSGSGVHIGGGAILTAAHVISDSKEVKVEYFGGGTVKAEVLWVNRAYDIALLHVERKVWPQAAPLDCAPNYVGQRVAKVGSPMDVVSVYTRGEVVGMARKHLIWQSVVPVDGALIYGQSGGGVVDERGMTVGVSVGLLATPYGIAAFGWVVPAEAICKLMARA